MNNNAIYKPRLLPLALATLAGLTALNARAEITLYDKDDTRFSTDGYINAFYVHTDTDRAGSLDDRKQSRVRMGFLPNYIGFNFGKTIDGLQLGARSSFWVTINDSQFSGTSTGIDVRQFYGTAGAEWGEVLIGKDFGLFARSNIFLDELLAGVGNVSDTVGLVDGGGVTFGNIGTGYPYAFPSSQITYRNKGLLVKGLDIAVGIVDPVNATGSTNAYEDKPRFETEVSYSYDFGGPSIYTWINGMHQTTKDTAPGVSDVNSNGLGYGLQGKAAGFSLTASGFKAKGIHTYFTNNLTQANLRNTDSNGWLLQGSYSFLDKNKLALSYGKSRDKGTGRAGIVGQRADYSTGGMAYFYTVNDNFKLVAEYNRFKIDGRDNNNDDENTKTLAFGAVINW